MDPKDEIKQKINIVDLISEYVVLKPAGSSGFKGLCPFHGEKTPSLHVSFDREIWHCFGCGEGGDCFSFVMKMEGISFPEALMHLGKKAGVEVRRLPTLETNIKQRLYAANDLAQKFFRKVLLDSSRALVARDYVASRAIPADLSERFGLGFAPDEWNALSAFLLKRGFSETELIQAGLSQKKKSGSEIIDRFRHRLMIPLRDHHGNTVGFTGRILSVPLTPRPNDRTMTHGRSQPGRAGRTGVGRASLSHSDAPKYMNSPETAIYHKGQLVFGLDLAKRAIREKGCVIIVEGNLDVIASHKDGVQHVVASSGTALTQDQLLLLKRYTDTFIFAFDSDAAGFAAAKKGISLARQLDADVRAAILPEGIKDPDELVQKEKGAWQRLVSTSVPIMEFLIAHVMRGKDTHSIDDKRLIAKELLPAISEMSSVIEREHWLQIVADFLHIDASALRTALTSVSAPSRPLPAEASSPNDRTMISRSVGRVAKTGSSPPRPLSKEQKIFRVLFGYAVEHPDQFDKILNRMFPFLSSDEMWTTLYNLATTAYDPNQPSAQEVSFFSRIRNLTTGHPKQEALEALLDTSIFMAQESFQDILETKVLSYIEHLFSLLNTLHQSREREALARDLRQAEQMGNQEEIKRLLATLDTHA